MIAPPLSPHDHTTGPSRRQTAAEVILIVLVFFTLAGHPPPHNNEAHYLCRMKHFWNPQWCAGDFFLQSADTQLLFVGLFGWLTKWLSLEATAWTGRLVVWTLLAWAWQRLSWRVAPRPWAALLSAALFVTLLEAAHLAGEWIVGGVEGKCFAYAFVLLALRDVLDRRWNRAILALGVATAFHPLVGGWSTIVCGGIWLLEDRAAVSPTSLVRGILGGGLLALVGVVPALALTWNQPPEVVAAANRIYVFERLPHHLALLTLPSGEITIRLARHGLLLVLLAALARGATQLARSAAARPVDMHAAPSATASEPGASDVAAARPWLWRLSLFAWGAALLALVGFTIELAFWYRPAIAAGLLRYYWFRLTDVAAPLAVALHAVWLVSAGLALRRRWAVWALAGAIAFSALSLGQVALNRLANPIAPTDWHMRNVPAWVEVTRWIAENTPPEAVFLTPRVNQTFKWRAGRAEVVTRKDIPQDAPSIVEWHARLRDIHYSGPEGPSVPVRSLGHLGTERIEELAARYGATFVVTDDRAPLSLPVVYWNERYVVYSIEPIPIEPVAL